MNNSSIISKISIFFALFIILMSLVNFSQNISPFGRKRDISQKCGTRVKNPIAKGVIVAHMLNDER